MALSDLLVNTVTIQPRVYDPADISSGGTPGTAVTWQASVQALSDLTTYGQQRLGDVVTHAVYFDRDPGVQVNDVINWGAKKLLVQAPAQDMGGRGVAFQVDCKLIQ
jgi:hypothetical protein